MPEEAMENALEWQTGEEEITVTLFRGKLQKRILKLAKQFPDLVTVYAGPEKNKGFLYAKIPVEWLKVAPPRALSEAQLAAAKKGLQRAHPER